VVRYRLIEGVVYIAGCEPGWVLVTHENAVLALIDSLSWSIDGLCGHTCHLSSPQSVVLSTSARAHRSISGMESSLASSWLPVCEVVDSSQA
jgi:hypothetical protein